MSRCRSAALLVLAPLGLGTGGTLAPPQARPVQDSWLARVSSETRPWTRWWWLGSAVDAATITRELEALRAAGFGGVEITPIYGVRGDESRFVPYLSDAWMPLLEHTLREARRLGLGVDMATGTGWPFGGPWVGEADAARCASLSRRVAATSTRPAAQRRSSRVGNQIYEVLNARRAARRTQAQPLRAGRAPSDRDLVEPVEANPNLQALALEQVRYPKAAAARGADGVRDASGDDARSHGARRPPTARSTGRAPAGRLDAVRRVPRLARQARRARGARRRRQRHRSLLARRDPALSRAIRSRLQRPRRSAGLRAFFNDSYEVDDATGQADWTPPLFDAFRERRGYDLREHLPALLGRRTPTTRAPACSPTTARRSPTCCSRPSRPNGARGRAARRHRRATRRTDRRRTCSISTRRATSRKPKGTEITRASGRPPRRTSPAAG